MAGTAELEEGRTRERYEGFKNLSEPEMCIECKVSEAQLEISVHQCLGGEGEDHLKKQGSPQDNTAVGQGFLPTWPGY